MRTDELDFDLPPELIAQVPAAQRAQSRLMHHRRSDRSIAHRSFADLPGLLQRGDLLVFNDARVIPARFTLIKETGGRVEALFLAQRAPGEWEVLLKNLGRASEGALLHFAAATDVTVRVVRHVAEGQHVVSISSDESAIELLRRVGRMPLPPYIRRDKDRDDRDELDRERYQTVFGQAHGSVAAPTAGLHFTPELLRAIDDAGIQRATVTLDVGMGTFKPVTADRVEEHAMHAESYGISPQTAEQLNAAKCDNRRIIAVGTTSARVLESQPDGKPFEAMRDQTSLLIYPPYRWKHVAALVTNFHLPRSTLIALVAAFVDLEWQRRLYQVAVQEKYRFFSYGDAMFLA